MRYSLRTMARASIARVGLIAMSGNIVLSSFAATMPIFTPVAMAADSIVVVTPTNMNGWTVTDDEGGPGASHEFVVGPATPPLGDGSLKMTITNGTAYSIARKPGYTGTRLDQITDLSYDTYINSYTNGQAPVLSLKFDNDGNGTTDDVLYFEPTYQNGTYAMQPGNGPIPNQCVGNESTCAILNTWQHWDAFHGGWWTSNDGAGGPPLRTLAGYLVAHPNATIVDEGGVAGFRVFGGGGVPMTGSFDNVSIQSNGNRTTYDFDPVPSDSTAPAVPTHLSPPNGSTMTSAALTIIDWTDVTDPSTPVTYVYQSSTNTATNPDGSFVSPAYTSGPLSTSEINASGTPEGTYYWHVRAVDGVGNSSAWSNYWTIIVDNTPPPVDNTAPAATFLGYRNQADGTYDSAPVINACGTTTSSQYIAFEWQEVGMDASQPLSYEYKILSGPAGVGYTQTHSDTHHNGGIPAEGTYVVQITPTDAAGNVGSPVTCEVTYDTTPPPAATCGNGGPVESGEQCDDGNIVNGDGCSSTCQDEAMACVPTDSDLVGYWKLDEAPAATTAEDSTTYNNDGTVNGNTVSGAPGAPGASYYNGGSYTFDGVNDSIDLGTNVGNFTVATPFTVSAWINPVLDFQNHAIYGNTWSNPGYLLRVTAENKIRFILVETGMIYNGVDSNVLTPGWHHVVGSWDGTNVKVFVDGVEESMSSVTNGTVTTITTTAHTFIGSTGQVGSEQLFNGGIDDVRVYDRALTLNEVQDLDGGACEAVPVVVPPSSGPQACTTTDTNLAGYWKFDEGTGTTTDDASSNDNDGTLNGPTWSTSSGGTMFANSGSLNFDGANDIVNVGNVPALDFSAASKFSVSTWVNQTASAGYQTIVQKMDDSTTSYPGYLFTLNNGTPEVWIISDYATSNYIVKTSLAPITTGDWHNVSFSYDGSSLASGVKIYVDGVDVTGASVGGSLTGPINTTASFGIGARGDGTVQPFNGSIDDVRVYGNVFGPTQITQLNNGQCNAGPFVAPPPPPPTTDTDNDGVLDAQPDNCVNDANPNQNDVDNDGIGDVCDPTNNNLSTFSAQNFEQPSGENTQGAGGHRGHGTNVQSARATYVAGFFGAPGELGGTPPAGYGGGELPLGGFGGGGPNVPFSSDEREYICTMQSGIPDDAVPALTDWLALYMATIMSRDASQVLEALQDPIYCAEAQRQSAAPAVQQVVHLTTDGVVVSTNDVWNACVTGIGLTKDLILSNRDVYTHRQGAVEKTVPKTCRDYHRGDATTWEHPDFPGLTVQLDSKGRLMGSLPAQYVAVKDAQTFVQK